MIVNNILSNAVSPSPLIKVHLPKTKSKIIKNNNNIIYCAKYPYLAGLFRKDIEETRKYGRKFCDEVAENMDNYGFFTTDERPEYGISYGISKKDYAEIFRKTEFKENRDLVVMFAYPEREALETKLYFEKRLRKNHLKLLLLKSGISEEEFPIKFD